MRESGPVKSLGEKLTLWKNVLESCHAPCFHVLPHLHFSLEALQRTAPFPLIIYSSHLFIPAHFWSDSYGSAPGVCLSHLGDTWILFRPFPPPGPLPRGILAFSIPSHCGFREYEHIQGWNHYVPFTLSRAYDVIPGTHHMISWCFLIDWWADSL